jgi:hypothetical protein
VRTYTEPQRLGAVLSGTIDPKPTTYRGVLMRSRLEAAFAFHLDLQGIEWTYEPEVFDGYLPDFLLQDSIYVEVKPTQDQVKDACARMLPILDRDPRAVIVVVCAEGCRWYARSRVHGWETWVERWAHR